MSRKRIIVIAVLLGVVVIGGVGAVGFWEYHERPEFCATCHIMEPYLASWQESDYGAYAHATEGVTCLECHVPTVQEQVSELVVYMQGDFTVPLEELEVSDEFCYDCHVANEHSSVEEVIQLTADRELNPHESHLIGEIDCDTCHKMHQASEDYCAECHDPLATGPGWTTEVTRTVEIDIWEPDMDCSVCHVMDPYVESLEDVNLLAYTHAQEGLACLDCHNDLEEVEQVHEEAVPGKRIVGKAVDNEFCVGCHLDNEHTSYEQVMGRTEGYIIEGMEINPHDPHPDADTVQPIDCANCHQMHEESPLITACYSCHHSGTLENCSVCHD
jgi:cytochrome c nitrite reductase small subunit